MPKDTTTGSRYVIQHNSSALAVRFRLEDDLGLAVLDDTPAGEGIVFPNYKRGSVASAYNNADRQ